MNRHTFEKIFCEDGFVQYNFDQWFFDEYKNIGRVYWEEFLPHAVEIENLNHLRRAFLTEVDKEYKIEIDYPKYIKDDPKHYWVTYTLLEHWDTIEGGIFERYDDGMKAVSGKIRLVLIFPFNKQINETEHSIFSAKIDGVVMQLDVDIYENNKVIVEFDCEEQFSNCKWQIPLETVQKPKITAKELENLNWQKFEDLMAHLLISLGYRKVKLTPRQGDKGRDIICELPTQFGSGVRCIVECKRQKSNIGAPEVRKLAGAVANEEFDFGIYITTSGFTRQAFEEFAIRRRNGHVGIELVDRKELLELLDSHGFLQ